MGNEYGQTHLQSEWENAQRSADAFNAQNPVEPTHTPINTVHKNELDIAALRRAVCVVAQELAKLVIPEEQSFYETEEDYNEHIASYNKLIHIISDLTPPPEPDCYTDGTTDSNPGD